jgi:hypothetical protein
MTAQLDLFAAETIPVAKRCDRCQHWTRWSSNYWGQCAVLSKPHAAQFRHEHEACGDYSESPAVNFDAIRARSYAVGDLVNTNGICGTLEDGSKFYCYMETIRLVEERGDGRWIGVIDMGLVHGKPWCKDGTRMVLTVDGMEPARRAI